MDFRREAVYQIKGWHLLLTVATLLVTMGVAWGTLRAQVEQNSRDIQDMKQERYVPKADYWRDQDDISKKLDTLSGKIDALTRLMK